MREFMILKNSLGCHLRIAHLVQVVNCSSRRGSGNREPVLERQIYVDVPELGAFHALEHN